MSSDLPVGTIIGERYEVVAYLGQGGFATVYEARHLHMRRAVAVKILKAGFEGPEAKVFEERFMLEATAAAQIEHANVVTVHDFGFTGPLRQPYIVMQLLRGRNLKDELASAGQMAPARVLSLFDGCLEALGQGHKQGIIHKDLKPANLFLDTRGSDEKLCIVDFGVARIETADVSRLTSTGQILGTPKYLAPEYLRDQIVTPSLDVYQMALILVECLSGYPVVDSSLPYTCILMHCTGELAVPVSLLESPLGPVIARALQIDHQERFANANEFRAALAAVDPASVPRVEPSAPCTFIVAYDGPLARRSGAYPVMGRGPARRPSGEVEPDLDLDAAPDETRYAASSANAGSNTKALVLGLGAAIVVLFLIAAALFVLAALSDHDAAQAQDQTGVNVARVEEPASADDDGEVAGAIEAEDPADAGQAAEADATSPSDGGSRSVAENGSEDAPDVAAVAASPTRRTPSKVRTLRKTPPKQSPPPAAETGGRDTPRVKPTVESDSDRKKAKKTMGIAP